MPATGGTVHDLRLAVRALRATPVVSLVAALSLALGIGANTAIFSLVNSLLLRALPVREPSRLALITDDSGRGINSWTNPIWEQIRSRPDLYDGAFAWSTTRFNLSAGGETQFVDGIWASRSPPPTMCEAADPMAPSPSSATRSGSAGSAAPPTRSASACSSNESPSRSSA
jgi:hypothetical protein